MDKQFTITITCDNENVKTDIVGNPNPVAVMTVLSGLLAKYMASVLKKESHKDAFNIIMKHIKKTLDSVKK